MKNVITIDGPSGSGKGTVSRIIAARLGYDYLDTGALYRAAAWKVRAKPVDPDDEVAVKNLLDETEISFKNGKVFVDGVDVTKEIRTAEIGELSSKVSAMPAVRQRLFRIQRGLCLKGSVVIEGRDTGTAIFPESENKFYLDASIEERARRRFAELKAKDPETTIEKTLDDIRRRDNRDSSRKASPLMKTEEMSFIDSTNMTIEEVAERIIKSLKA
ncbi:MAG: (d)CMP kinase [Nitrospirae bacterium]|nr:(d)CMP kinase [Nitrospirota bacterium]